MFNGFFQNSNGTNNHGAADLFTAVDSHQPHCEVLIRFCVNVEMVHLDIVESLASSPLSCLVHLISQSLSVEMSFRV